MRIMRSIVTLLAIGAIGGGVYYVMQGETPGGPAKSRFRMAAGGSGPVSVVAKNAAMADVPIFLEGVGAIRALNLATVRAQVDGILISVNFKEGQDVKRGDVLAKIDPVTYQAQLDQALAKKALDEALLANTKRDLARYQKVGTLAISQQQIDTQKALAQQQEAQIKSDDAAIENAKAILGYTTIVAPFDGRTGIRIVDEGNLVHAGDAGGIVVITQIQPISALFTLPQQDLPALNSSQATGRLKAQALSTDGKTELDSGFLEVIDNQVDQQTGTIRLKANFPNERRQLWPGQFVNIRILVDTLKNVVVAPAEAVQRGPEGDYVYLVQADKTVAMRRVTISRQDEKQAVIADGVKSGDMLVVSGFGRLKDGTTVSISDGAAAPSDAGVAAKPRQRGGKAAHVAGEGAQSSASTADSALVTGSTGDPTRTADSTKAGVPADTRNQKPSTDSGTSP